jgi:transposase-like protein
VVEIITGVERRRNWRPEDKLRILAELGEPGAKFVEVARRNEGIPPVRAAFRRGAEPVF